MTKALSGEEKKERMERERQFLTQLFEAAYAGDAKTLEETVDGCVRQNEGISPFQVLSEYKDGEKRGTLHFACQSLSNHETDIVETILQDKWFPTLDKIQVVLKQKDKSGLTPIMLAAQHKDPVIAEKRVLYLLNKAGNDLKLGLARSQAGATALHYAAGAGATPAAIQGLYEAGHVAISTFSNRGGTPLHWACSVENDFSATLDALLQCGADVNAQQSEEGNFLPPPLVLALAAGNQAHAQRLLQTANIDIKVSLPGDLTLLHMAADMNLTATLRLLKEKLGDDTAIMGQKNHDGLTSLDLAAKDGYAECVQLLLPKKDATLEDARAYIMEFAASAVAKKKSTIPILAKETTEDAKEASSSETSKTSEGPAEEIEARQIAQAVLASSDVSPDDANLALELKAQGNACFGQKKWSQAHDLYTRAISVNPKEATFYSNRSACSIAVEQPAAALDDAIIALALKPTWPKAHYRVAMARFKLERFEDAAMAAWDGLQEDETNDELRSLLQKAVKRGRQDYLQKQKESEKEETNP